MPPWQVGSKGNLKKNEKPNKEQIWLNRDESQDDQAKKFPRVTDNFIQEILNSDGWSTVVQ